jgi:hypothetical protein
MPPLFRTASDQTIDATQCPACAGEPGFDILSTLARD